MNRISKKNGCLLILGIALLLSLNPALGREGRGDSFMRAFGMTVKDDSFVHSYQDWSSRLFGTEDTGRIGPVLAAFGDNFDDMQEEPGWLGNLFSFGGSIVINQVSYTFLPYNYTYGTR
jgi:hypothetical protein